MNNSIEKTLEALMNDTSVVIHLYQELYNGSFFLFVRTGTESNLAQSEFLVYPTSDGVHELPVFTNTEFMSIISTPESKIILIPGPDLWPRLYEIIESCDYEVAVNPGQSHGIRLTSSTILGMISQYSQPA